MPCGASTLMIQVVAQNGGGHFVVRNFTSKDFNNNRDIGLNVFSNNQHQFRIQARVNDFKSINCPNPKFSGELCYTKYVDTPDCQTEKAIAIWVPIATAIIGVLGGIGGVIIKQRFERKSNGQP